MSLRPLEGFGRVRVLDRDALASAVVAPDHPDTLTRDPEQLQIVDGDRHCAKSVSYNPRVGFAYSVRTSSEISLSDQSTLIELQPGESLRIRSRESFRMGTHQAGIAFGRVVNALSSVVIDTTFIDPGFEGRLRCVLRNFSNRPAHFDLSTPIMKVVIFEFENSEIREELQISEAPRARMDEAPDEFVGKARTDRRGRVSKAIGGGAMILCSLVGAAYLWPEFFVASPLLTGFAAWLSLGLVVWGEIRAIKDGSK